MMETVDSDGIVRDDAGVPVDRIEGGALARAERDFRGIAPGTVLIGGVIIILIGLLLGWYLFHGGSRTYLTPARTAAGGASTTDQRDAITQEQARVALAGGAVGGGPVTGAIVGPDGTTIVPNQANNQYPVGMVGAAGQQGATSMQGNASGQRPIDPRVALALASRRAPIMGFSGGLGSALEQSSAGPSQGQGEHQGAGQDFALGGGSGEGDAAHQDGANGARMAPPAGPTAGHAQDGLSAQLAHHVIETARATVIGDRSMLLSAGTLIPCTLQTAINSTQAGYVSCVIGHDVYSEDGRVVLLDKGTKVLGQYAGGIEQGQARLFVLWTRALTPRGVAIDLGSPAADDLGRAGMAGGVDTMFWQRFGGALMLSVLQDLGNIASTHFAGEGSQTTQVPSNTASTALQGTINIRPILKKNEGDQVSIFVAKDFDFSDVYDLHVKR